MTPNDKLAAYVMGIGFGVAITASTLATTLSVELAALILVGIGVGCVGALLILHAFAADLRRRTR